ncbi:MAG: hypothetical protein AABX11_01635 [Nanoarchaeota archaeon]
MHFFEGYESFNGEQRRQLTATLMSEWYGYANMRGGFNSSPSVSFAKTRILNYARLLEGKTGIDEVRKELVLLGNNSKSFYFAIGGHGGLMGGGFEKDVIKVALRNKFGSVPHSFRTLVDGEGRINFEKVSCKDCRFLRGCSMREMCNCYNDGEFREGRAKMDRDNQEVKIYIKRYFSGRNL